MSHNIQQPQKPAAYQGRSVAFKFEWEGKRYELAAIGADEEALKAFWGKMGFVTELNPEKCPKVIMVAQYTIGDSP